MYPRLRLGYTLVVRRVYPDSTRLRLVSSVHPDNQPRVTPLVFPIAVLERNETESSRVLGHDRVGTESRRGHAHLASDLAVLGSVAMSWTRPRPLASALSSPK